MKKLIALVLSLALVLSCASSALALNFTGRLGNESTFETLQEASKSSVDVVANIVENNAVSPLSPAADWVEHPVLANYPEGTTYVYRSADQYAGRAAARLNTNLFVYVDQKFESKDAAYAFLKDAGLIDIIEEAVGSILLVSPIGNEFGTADAAAYYALQTAALSQKERGTDAEGKPVKYSSAEYFGGYGYTYFIGIDGGATFFNNYIAPEIDFVGRIAGALLIGGSMQHIRKPATFVPVYFVNGQDKAIEKYKAINGVDAKYIDDSVTVSYNQAWPLRKVVEAKMDKVDVAAAIKDAYYGLFVKAMRLPVLPQGMYSAGSTYYGYGFDQAPYSLSDRSYIVDGKTAADVYVISVQGSDYFSNIKSEATGEYIDVWYEYLPKEVLENTAPAGSVPLILCNHGGGDDARVFVEEFGLLELADKERVALIAPDHQLCGDIRGPALTACVDYMLEKYPALDPTRVYATGYSMGGGATYIVGYYAPEKFAAVAPLAGSPTAISDEEMAKFADIDLPVLQVLSSFDSLRRLDAMEGNMNEAQQGMVKTWTAINEIETADFDFETYPHWGQKPDYTIIDTINDEFEVETWYKTKDGVPIYAYSLVKGMIHCLYGEYADLLWNYVKHFSRDLETGAVIYTPYAK